MTSETIYSCKHCIKVFSSQRSVGAHNYQAHRKENDLQKLSYLANPKICPEPSCQKDIPYIQRNNQTCSNSCARKLQKPISESTRLKLSISKRNISDLTRQKMSNSGKNKILSESTRLKISEAGKRRKPVSDETRLKLSQAARRNHPEKFEPKLIFKFRFNIFNYPDLFDLDYIKTVGFFCPGGRKRKLNLNGLSRDHRVSIHESIQNNYDPYYISHPINCNIIPQTENIKKYTKSSLKYEDLVIMVNDYDKLYGKYNYLIGHAPPAQSKSLESNSKESTDDINLVEADNALNSSSVIS